MTSSSRQCFRTATSRPFLRRSIAKAFAHRGLHLIVGEHDVATNLAQINAMTREFVRLVAETQRYVGHSGSSQLPEEFHRSASRPESAAQETSRAALREGPKKFGFSASLTDRQAQLCPKARTIRSGK